MVLYNKNLVSLSVSYPCWFVLRSREDSVRAPDEKSQRPGFKGLAMGLWTGYFSTQSFSYTIRGRGVMVSHDCSEH